METIKAHREGDLETAHISAAVSGRTLIVGAIGGLIGIFFYKTCELLVQGMMGGGFQFTFADKVTTAILILVIVGLMRFVPSSRREIKALREENGARLRELAQDLERLKSRWK